MKCSKSKTRKVLLLPRFHNTYTFYYPILSLPFPIHSNFLHLVRLARASVGNQHWNGKVLFPKTRKQVAKLSCQLYRFVIYVYHHQQLMHRMRRMRWIFFIHYNVFFFLPSLCVARPWLDSLSACAVHLVEHLETGDGRYLRFHALGSVAFSPKTSSSIVFITMLDVLGGN